MEEHKKFLSDRLLSEERPVTYRLLSRAMNIHVNTAKEMLQAFHVYQNGLCPNSIHATYIIYGTKVADSVPERGRINSKGTLPDLEALSVDIPVINLTIAAEESLLDALNGYKKVTSLHIYSLAPHQQSDLTLLSELSKSLLPYVMNQDPSLAGGRFGTVLNPGCNRKARKGVNPLQTQSLPKLNKKEMAVARPSPVIAKIKPENEVLKNPPRTFGASKKVDSGLRQGVSDDIMQSFAKAATKLVKPIPLKLEQDDLPSAMSDDGEADVLDISPSEKLPRHGGPSRKSKKEREEDLRLMMEEYNQDNNIQTSNDGSVDEEMQEAPELELEPEAEPESKEVKEPTEVISSSGDGRRRGKRWVMKKKRILDDQGYMVTIQEPGWESFSEDEAATSMIKSTATSTPSASGQPKKSVGKGSGQGNIMSFFSKK